MNIIKDYIFEENKLNFNKIEDIIAESSGPSIDLSDLYMQYTTVESWTCEDGIRDRSPSRGLGDVYKRQIYIATYKTFSLFKHI